MEIFEGYDEDFARGWLSRERLNEKKAAFLQIERDAFVHADFVLFPSRDAMEPYFSTWPEFENLIAGKNLLFAETGVEEKPAPARERRDAEEKFGLSHEAKFRVCYLGRHNGIKGYDVLTKAARILRERSPETEFAVGGNAGPISAPTALPTWRECGYVNPRELLSACDIFVLPNRETYFDLVLLEALSSGIPILASRTGGNRSVAEKTRGVILFDSDDGGKNLAREILRVSEMPKADLENLGHENREAYLRHYTAEAFAKRLHERISEISYENV